MTDEDYYTVRSVVARPAFRMAYDREYRLWYNDLRKGISHKDKLEWDMLIEGFYDEYGYYPPFCGSREAMDQYELTEDSYV